jgi:hypothetical protein
LSYLSKQKNSPMNNIMYYTKSHLSCQLFSWEIYSEHHSFASFFINLLIKDNNNLGYHCKNWLMIKK